MSHDQAATTNMTRGCGQHIVQMGPVGAQSSIKEWPGSMKV